jgi:membrane protein
MATPRQDLVRTIIGRLPVPERAQAALFLGYDTAHNYSLHRDGETAAAIAYYSLFALFPLILVTMSILGYILGSSDRQAEIVGAIADRIPGSRDLVLNTVGQVLRARGTITILALVTLLWSASGVFSLLAIAINRAWCTDCGRPYWQEKLVGITLALLIGVLVLIAIASSGFVQIAHQFGDSLFPPAVAAILGQLDIAGFLFGVIANVAAFFVIYKYIPTIHVPWRAALLGALTAGIAWEAAKYIFTWYLSTFAIRNFRMVYGSLSAVLALLLWVYFSAVILLLGSELSATYVQGTFRSRPRLKLEGHE